MLTERAIETESVAGTTPRPRVALVCDFLEENWPSMEVVGNMLLHYLRQGHSTELEAVQLRPAMRRRFTRQHSNGPRSALWNADRLTNRFLDYPRWVRRRASQFDLFHIVDHSYAQLVHTLPPERTVVTCHDLDTFRCLLEPEREPQPYWFRAMSRRILAGFERVAQVVAVSDATRDAILRHGLLPEERITVIHNGIHPACSPGPNSDADQELSRLAPAISSGGPWLLHVGSTIARKRLDVLLRVLAAVRKELPGTRLLRIGGPFTPQQEQLARELSVGDSIVFLSGVTPEILAAAYRRADVLLQTSESEGFGLPVVEAQACGCPVVASDIAVLREVGGSAAVYCPLEDIEGWKDAVVRIRGERASGAETGTRRPREGIANAARFSWAESARRLAAVYQAVLERAHRN